MVPVPLRQLLESALSLKSKDFSRIITTLIAESLADRCPNFLFNRNEVVLLARTITSELLGLISLATMRSVSSSFSLHRS